MEIVKTTNYNDFKVIMSNREVDKRHVKKLAASIRRKNLLFVRPLIVNSRMEVIDGQHRLAAAQQIKAPVYYIKCDGLTKEDIAALNTAQKNWTRLDFINFYAIEGQPQFRELARLINKYSALKVSFILTIVGDCKKLRQGQLRLNNLEYAHSLCRKIQQIYDEGFTFVAERDFGIALHEVLGTMQVFNPDRLLIRITPETFYKCSSKAEYKLMIKGAL